MSRKPFIIESFDPGRDDVLYFVGHNAEAAGWSPYPRDARQFVNRQAAQDKIRELHALYGVNSELDAVAWS